MYFTVSGDTSARAASSTRVALGLRRISSRNPAVKW